MRIPANISYPTCRPLILIFLLLSSYHLTFAADRDRLGDFYTSIPLYRSGSGTNVIPVGVGTSPQFVNLTLTTNSEFVLIAGGGCDDCVEHGNVYSSSSSASYDPGSQDLIYTMIYPIGSADTLEFAGSLGRDILRDPRGDVNTPRPIASVNKITRDSLPTSNAIVRAGSQQLAITGEDVTLSDGTSGFWGLGVYQDEPSLSILPSMLDSTNDGVPENNQTYYTVGFNISSYQSGNDVQAGTIHWGGVPMGTYVGDFNWIQPDTTKGGSWAIAVERMRVEGKVVDLSNLYGTLDPGYDSILVPTAIAEQFYAGVDGATRDARDATRWNLPCEANISMTITISGREFNVERRELVQPREVSGISCWGSVVAWHNGSVAESLGEIRLGTPFMSGVYTALFYEPGGQLVGIAGKPGTVNDFNVRPDSGGPNTKLAGILIGVLLPILILIFVGLYARNRDSFQSRWYRAIRRQHRFQTNAVIRGATLPPMMPPPLHPMHPGMMPHPPIGPGMPPPFMPPGGPMAPYGSGPGATYSHPWAPPPYQSSPHQHARMHPGAAPLSPGDQMPRAVDATPAGYYSPRTRPVSQPIIPAIVRSPPQNELQASHTPNSHHRHLSLPVLVSQNQPPIPPESSRTVRWGQGSKIGRANAQQVGGGYADEVDSRVPVAPQGSNYDPQTKTTPPAIGAKAADSRPSKRYDDWLNSYSGPGQGGDQPYPRRPAHWSRPQYPHLGSNDKKFMSAGSQPLPIPPSRSFEQRQPPPPPSRSSQFLSWRKEKMRHLPHGASEFGVIGRSENEVTADNGESNGMSDKRGWRPRRLGRGRGGSEQVSGLGGAPGVIPGAHSTGQWYS
ncbi:aspartic peptidase domain-containing protein [Kockovaella imperatae]|uniref:Aspartic peptidase domain-containing protein n=1 Tax=Kockovaella imperatae TaxID=4999 RepID=A0A1Y1UIR6_9TREE|nr:aspartic peptidase domain-containing protein [Kockovaella imperatae]ORX37386.1 aspartic peptidase domain-containing protein [Kockovaella imperatae]